MEQNIKKLLWTIDGISYVSAIYSIFIRDDYEWGAILTIVSLLFHFFLYINSRETVARRLLVIFFNINNSQDKGKKSFI